MRLLHLGWPQNDVGDLPNRQRSTLGSNRRQLNNDVLDLCFVFGKGFYAQPPVRGVLPSDAGPVDSKIWLNLTRVGVGERVTTPDGTEGQIMIRDTWNTQMVCELEPEPGDIVVSKHRYSGFYGTDLELILRGLEIQYLVFTGCTTSVCVESTMRDAMERDFRCVLLADCAGEPIGQGLPRSNHDASLLVLQIGFGWVSDSAYFIAALDAQPVVSQKLA